MFDLLSTLIRGANTRAAGTVADHFDLDPVTPKIREAEAGVAGAKQVLATLVMRQRAELQALDTLRTLRASHEEQARAAIAAGDEDLATEGARTVAGMENEEAARREALARLEGHIRELRQSVDDVQRRIAALRRGSGTEAEMAAAMIPALSLYIDAPQGAHRHAPRVELSDVLARLRTTPVTGPHLHP